MMESDNYHDNIINNAIMKFRDGDVTPLKGCINLLKSRYQAYTDTEFADDRSGEETYGYNNIDGDMEYIADRWNCAFRLRWLIDGIEDGHFKETNERT